MFFKLHPFYLACIFFTLNSNAERSFRRQRTSWNMVKNSISEKMPPQGAEFPAAARSYSALGDAVEAVFYKYLKNSILYLHTQDFSRVLSSKRPSPLAPLPTRKWGTAAASSCRGGKGAGGIRLTYKRQPASASLAAVGKGHVVGLDFLSQGIRLYASPYSGTAEAFLCSSIHSSHPK